MDDGTGFTFPPVGQDSSHVSWGDMFLDEIQSDDHQNALEKLASDIDLPSETTTAPVITQQLIQQPPQQQLQQHQQHIQQQQSIMGGQMHIQIPGHLQGTLQSTNPSLPGTVAYLASSAPSVSMTATGSQALATSSVTQQATGAKLLQIASNFPVAPVQQVQQVQHVQQVQPLASSVPLQTFLPSNGQAIYRSQSGLFPTQGSVHIENPKVVNVNFGPHVIGSDGSSQQTYIQTAEGKPVIITNSQLQQMSQSLGLAQPLVSGQLVTQGTAGIHQHQQQQQVQVQPQAQQPQQQARQIVLPSGQAAAVIPRQQLRQLNPGVIYPAGQTGQLQLQPQSTALITSSGSGLQVVNPGAANQGNQLQLLTQGQQQVNQNTIMNLLNNQGILNNGIVPAGQNIFLNGQVVNLAQIGGLTMQQLQPGLTLAGQLQQQQQQQQPLFLQQSNNNSVNVVGSTAGTNSTHMLLQQQQQQMQQKVTVGNITKPSNSTTPGSNCSTPAATPTPTPTPDPGMTHGKDSSGTSILEKALSMSQIDLQSFEDDLIYSGIGMEEIPASNTPTALAPTPTPTPTPAVTPPSKPKPKKQPKKAKTSTPQHLPSTSLPSSQSKVVSMNGQMYVVSTSGQQLLLQQSKLKGSTATIQSPQLLLAQTSTAPTASQKQQKNVLVSASMQKDNKVYIRTSSDSMPVIKSQTGFQAMRNASDTPVNTANTLLLQHEAKIKPQKITTLEGSFVKQEPFAVSVKKEVVLSPQSTSSNSALVAGTPIISSSVTTTMTTQFHQSTIMTVMPSMPTNTLTTSSSSINSKSNSKKKEKDPNSIKTMTSIAIGNSTLELSLTRAEKEHLEEQVSKMSAEEQTQLLTYQHNIQARLSQVAQQHKLQQQQQHSKQQQQQQAKQHVQQKQQTKKQPRQQQQYKPPPPSQQPLPGAHPTVKSEPSPLPEDIQKAQQSGPGPPQDSGSRTLPHVAPPVMSVTSNQSSIIGLPITVQELEEERQEQKKKVGNSVAPQQEKQFQQSKPVSVTNQPLKQQTQPTQSHLSVPPVRAQPKLAFLGRCLAEQQLVRDRQLAVTPDTTSAYKNHSDAMRRLVRYHTLQDHKPGEADDDVVSWDAKYSKVCEVLMKKKRYFMRRYSKLRLYVDMCPERRPESLQNLLCFNEQLQETIAAEKEEARNHPETFQPVYPFKQVPSSPEESISLIDQREPPQDCGLQSDDSSKKSSKKHKSSGSNLLTEQTIKEEVTESRIKEEMWESPRPVHAGMKRKASPEKASSGTLKLVFKRRTTDGFCVSSKVKPVVSSPKCDEDIKLEFSSDQAAVKHSLTSQCISVDGSSELSEDVDSGQSAAEEEDEDEEEGSEMDSCADEEEHENSGEDCDEPEDNEGNTTSRDDSRNKREDMADSETKRLESEQTPPCANGAIDRLKSKGSSNKEPIVLSDKSDLKANDAVLSVPSNQLLKSSNSKENSNKYKKNWHLSSEDIFCPSVDNECDNSQNSLAVSIRSPMHHPGLSAPPPILSTPSKNLLLQTDDMFNSSPSSSEDEDGASSQSRLGGHFRIDNRDPQSSMMNASVRSAIYNVLNHSDDE